MHSTIILGLACTSPEPAARAPGINGRLYNRGRLRTLSHFTTAWLKEGDYSFGDIEVIIPSFADHLPIRGCII
jgi:hypothetical protein